MKLIWNNICLSVYGSCCSSIHRVIDHHFIIYLYFIGYVYLHVAKSIVPLQCPISLLYWWSFYNICSYPNLTALWIRFQMLQIAFLFIHHVECHEERVLFLSKKPPFKRRNWIISLPFISLLYRRQYSLKLKRSKSFQVLLFGDAV